MHIDKLLPYQADFEEELHSWLKEEESGGHRVAGTQGTDAVPSDTSPEVSTRPSSQVVGSSLDIGPAYYPGTDLGVMMMSPPLRLPLLGGDTTDTRLQVGVHQLKAGDLFLD